MEKLGGVIPGLEIAKALVCKYPARVLGKRGVTGYYTSFSVIGSKGQSVIYR
jgi:hypothetical protein